MRYLVALLVLLVLVTGARANEPFGTIYKSRLDIWAFSLQMRFVGKDKLIIEEIAAQVRQKPQEHWLSWVNQLVNLRVELVNIKRNGTCGPLAVAKYQVLRALGFAKEDLRLVVGEEDSFPDRHAVLAVRTAGGWRVLDNGHLVSSHVALLDNQINKKFRALYAFN